MTATSGPGFSLMSEALGFASMAEIPAVIVDAQRAGPSTGMPTKMEQSDLSFALSMSHGDTPRMVVAPANVADCYSLMVLAFNMAERYQMPVIFLTDQSLTARVESVDHSAFRPLEIEERIKYGQNGVNGHAGAASNGHALSEEEHAFARYAYTASGVSPTTTPARPATVSTPPRRKWRRLSMAWRWAARVRLEDRCVFIALGALERLIPQSDSAYRSLV